MHFTYSTSLRAHLMFWISFFAVGSRRRGEDFGDGEVMLLRMWMAIFMTQRVLAHHGRGTGRVALPDLVSAAAYLCGALHFATRLAINELATF
ncbi:hypothetical protein CYMTET_7366 [Cymbomonas tetramitiformis]|uniref:Uncharacterized protein n=1 Tax=Cymbomonas tetramitiformis TaxID=36881 RepID=A0AAE0GV46_9CHLO|nr:hypothetical protein CYMTET_37424 [Cymbomonas tetramitiformis]KAK3274323.1 hypothetical protein CYMTET_17477 [Cymbomonas tetramitiformis]KAK3278989.1 hypothetical protein CYMTET_13111 [Cymbomonas tetramitiformis]KAK3279562.1 hypothetical protein CYMTET_12574 [Cymbomonas tetramitiformis]KAK3285009.1 hypothetical protein CYMTET_7366 [Cymbomonas tetramitiformis]